jgi:hypothetical protein
MIQLRKIWRDTHAAGAAEFALVLPLLLLLLFGIIDAGRFMWEYNRAEKATQMGVRYAVVTDPVLGQGFNDYSFSIEDGVPQGSAVPSDDFDSATCNESSCTCTGGGVCGSISHDETAFANLVNRMSAMYPPIEPQNVEIQYRNVGLGYAGDPHGPDVSPLITVRLTGLSFQPVTTLLFGAALNMPDFRASLTGEDLSGTVSN